MSGSRVQQVRILVAIFLFFSFLTWSVDAIYGDDSKEFQEGWETLTDGDIEDYSATNTFSSMVDVTAFIGDVANTMTYKDERIPFLIGAFVIFPLDVLFILTLFSFLVGFIPLIPSG